MVPRTCHEGSAAGPFHGGSDDRRLVINLARRWAGRKACGAGGGGWLAGADLSGRPRADCSSSLARSSASLRAIFAASSSERSGSGCWMGPVLNLGRRLGSPVPGGVEPPGVASPSASGNRFGSVSSPTANTPSARRYGPPCPTAKPITSRTPNRAKHIIVIRELLCASADAGDSRGHPLASLLLAEVGRGVPGLCCCRTDSVPPGREPAPSGWRRVLRNVVNLRP